MSDKVKEMAERLLMVPRLYGSSGIGIINLPEGERILREGLKELLEAASLVNDVQCLGKSSRALAHRRLAAALDGWMERGGRRWKT